jgi:hypothetical protein
VTTIERAALIVAAVILTILLVTVLLDMARILGESF